MSRARIAKNCLKWMTTIFLLLQCQCIDFQNNPFFQNIKIHSNQNLANIYPNNPFVQAASRQKTVTERVVVPKPKPAVTTVVRQSAASPPKTSDSPDICGRPLSTNELILHGVRTRKGEWPWIVALFYQTSNDKRLHFVCGGNLISRSYVISAGHCVTSLEIQFGEENYAMVAYLGLFDLTNRNSPGVQKKTIDKMFVHPDYKPGTPSDSDISVLHLSTPAEYSLFVRPICLWKWKWKPDLEYVVGSNGRVIGWGRDENGEESTNVPQAIDLPIVSQQQCRASHADFHHITTDRTFCAGSRNNSGPCNGDSGSGLLVLMKDGQINRWYLRGIVSLSLRSKNFQCDLEQYVIFTDVPQFKVWLKDFIADYN